MWYIDNIGDIINEAIDSIKSTANDITSKINKTYQDFSEKLKQSSDIVIEKIKDEITNIEKNLCDDVVKMIQSVCDKLSQDDYNNKINLELLCSNLVSEYTKIIEYDLFFSKLYSIPIIRILKKQVSVHFSDDTETKDLAKLIFGEAKGNENLPSIESAVSKIINEIANSIIGAKKEDTNVFQSEYVILDSFNLVKRNIITYSRNFDKLGIITKNQTISISILYESLVDFKRLDYQTFRYYYMSLFNKTDLGIFKNEIECRDVFNLLCNYQYKVNNKMDELFKQNVKNILFNLEKNNNLISELLENSKNINENIKLLMDKMFKEE